MCGGHEDTVSHMLQCEMVKGDLRVKEAFDQLISSMEGRTMKSRGDAGDILKLTELVQWTRNTHQGSNAHKVLLGNCDLRCVPFLRTKQAFAAEVMALCRLSATTCSCASPASFAGRLSAKVHRLCFKVYP